MSLQLSTREMRRPLATDGKPPAWVARLTQRFAASPAKRIAAAELRRLGVDPARARRYFLKHHGMRFQSCCRARRLSDAFRRIRGGRAVSEVAHDSGCESESGFRAAFARVFGSAPSAAKASAAITLSWIETAVSPLVVGTTDEAICLLEFRARRMLETQLRALRRRFRAVLVPGSNRLVTARKGQLDDYLAGRRRELELPLCYPGTSFQQ